MKIFVSGSISIKKLPQIAVEKLDSIIAHNFTVLVGDANGVDCLIQEYLKQKSYPNVQVYYAGSRIRNNLNNWQMVNVASNLTGRALYTQKDKKMAQDSDYGMMIWDGKSKGTKANIAEMSKYGKHFYVIQNEGIVTDKMMELE
ncbi:hypothetical protein [Treponema sp.]|uniref:hypothetical protein n=1 Tax=Treponema sp. TaxID=166 RepID=UPI0025E40BF5|nr:hypothetical protein [Treponema sp.]MBR4321146.1 hypothetical protein [Treponema sp.]